MITRKKIFLDLDGVLSDLVRAVAEFYKKDASLVTKWKIHECWNMEELDVWTPLDYHFWANLPLTKEAREVARMCINTVGEDRIFILTSPCHIDGCFGSREGKQHWVDKHFPYLSRKCFIGSDKYACASDNALLIDDSDEKCEAFRKEGGYACLFPRPWNSLRDLSNTPLTWLQAVLERFENV